MWPTSNESDFKCNMEHKPNAWHRDTRHLVGGQTALNRIKGPLVEYLDFPSDLLMAARQHKQQEVMICRKKKNSNSVECLFMAYLLIKSLSIKTLENVLQFKTNTEIFLQEKNSYRSVRSNWACAERVCVASQQSFRHMWRL